VTRKAATKLSTGATIVPASGPLTGRRVLVTRPTDRADELITALAAAGATPVTMPLVQTIPPTDWMALDAAVDHVMDYDWIVFTSAEAVGPFFARLTARGRTPAHLAGARIAAVGPATAERLVAAGRPADLVPEDQRAAALPAAMGVLTGRHILLPRADIAPPELATVLRGAGAAVNDVVAYRTVPVTPEPSVVAAVAKAGLDVITFASGSSVRSFMALPQAAKLLGAAHVACLGPSTTAAAQAAGLTVDIVAAEPTTTELVAAIVRFYAAESDGQP
jgi:uroporphyrinogen III methyltransferase/synthase